MIADYINILGEDKETKTVFAQGYNGSVTLDIIPAAVNYLKLHAKYDNLYLQDYRGTQLLITQQSNVRTAVSDWENLVYPIQQPNLQFPQEEESSVQQRQAD